MTIKTELQNLVDKFFKPSLADLGLETIPVFIGPLPRPEQVPCLVLIFETAKPELAFPIVKQKTKTEAESTSYFTVKSGIIAYHNTEPIWPSETLLNIVLQLKQKQALRTTDTLQNSSILSFEEVIDMNKVFSDSQDVLFAAAASFLWGCVLKQTVTQKGLCLSGNDADQVTDHVPEIRLGLSSTEEIIFKKDRPEDQSQGEDQSQSEGPSGQ